jgi:hypothetical protein
MARKTIYLALLAIAACTIYDPGKGDVNIVSPGNFKAGSGEIYQVGVLRREGDPHCRLFLRMDVTGTQFVDVDKCSFLAGEFVDLTNDGRVVRLSGTSLNESLNRGR